LTPEAVLESTQYGTGIFIKLVDDDDRAIVYYLDNGWNNLPDGQSIRARYGAAEGPIVFEASNLPGDPVSWAQKAVEPLVVALRQHMTSIRESE
jgi:hypothetical protein